MATTHIDATATVTRFDRRDRPAATVRPGDRLRIATTDAAYASLTGEDLDQGRVPTSVLNAITGPIAVEEARPGDALQITIEAIDVGPRAYAVYVSRWRRRMFGVEHSVVQELAIREGAAWTESGLRLELTPMIGCIGVAPAAGALSTLSPTGRTGGNMDLVELAAGSTIWLPVEVDGALLSLGDLHAAMGRGEPAGSGLECAGVVTCRVDILQGRAPDGPCLMTADAICFVGTDASSEGESEAEAVRAAWNWLRITRGVSERDALALCAAALEVRTGGPAGSNVVAALPRAALHNMGVDDHLPLPAARE